jgi:hypothetical protein
MATGYYAPGDGDAASLPVAITSAGGFRDPSGDPTIPVKQQGTNPLSGFAKQYDPSALENIWQNPWSILTDVFKNLNTEGGGYQSLRNLNADPLTLYNLMAGRSSDLANPSGTGVGDYTNWLANLYKSLGTVGGRGFSAGELLQNLFNPGAAGSALNNIVTAGDQSQQMRTIFNMAKDASNVGMNPLAARGYQSMLSRVGDQAINQSMKTDANGAPNNAPMFEILKKLMPALVPR